MAINAIQLRAGCRAECPNRALPDQLAGGYFREVHVDAQAGQFGCRLIAARYNLGIIIAAASHEISTSQFKNMLRMNVANQRPKIYRSQTGSWRQVIAEFSKMADRLRFGI